MDGDSVEIGDHVTLLFIEFAFGVLFVSLKEWLEIGVLRCAAEDFLVELFDYFEIADAEYEEIRGILSDKWAYNSLTAQ